MVASRRRAGAITSPSSRLGRCTPQRSNCGGRVGVIASDPGRDHRIAAVATPARVAPVETQRSTHTRRPVWSRPSGELRRPGRSDRDQGVPVATHRQGAPSKRSEHRSRRRSGQDAAIDLSRRVGAIGFGAHRSPRTGESPSSRSDHLTIIETRAVHTQRSNCGGRVGAIASAAYRSQHIGKAHPSRRHGQRTIVSTRRSRRSRRTAAATRPRSTWSGRITGEALHRDATINARSSRLDGRDAATNRSSGATAINTERSQHTVEPQRSTHDRLDPFVLTQ